MFYCFYFMPSYSLQRITDPKYRYFRILYTTWWLVKIFLNNLILTTHFAFVPYNFNNFISLFSIMTGSTNEDCKNIPTEKLHRFK